MTGVSAVLFAKDLERVSNFYEAALGLRRKIADEDHVALDCRGFSLIIHQIPRTLVEPDISAVVRREDAALRLNFPVNDVAAARELAKTCGGQIDRTAPAWADADANVFLGHDPEGNVFKVSEAR